MSQRVGTLPPHQIFTVSDSVRYLEPQQLDTFLYSFDAWCSSATRKDHKRSRERVRAVFLLLRYTGARLGEVLSIDEEKSFDFTSKTVTLGHDETRRVIPLEADVCARLKELLESSLAYSLRGHFFKIDPGYVRRVFYARAMDCGLPKELANPRVIRTSRALEMLRSGVPLTVVKSALGHLSPDVVEYLQSFSSDDVTCIVRKAHQKMKDQTSARNTFAGHVARVVEDGIMAEVEVTTESGYSIFSTVTKTSLENLHIVAGTPVMATVKAPLVNLYPHSQSLSASGHNFFSCSIDNVASSSVLAEVAGHLADGTGICALVSNHTLQNLELQTGDLATMHFKEMSVVLQTVI